MSNAVSDVLPLLVPLIVLEVVLIALAIYDLVHRERVRFDNKWVWGAVILFVSLLGPLAYFIVGREED